MAGAGWRGSPALRHDFPRLCSELRSHKICSPQTFLAPQAAKTVSVHLNTCLNTTFLVSTPVSTPLFSSQHLRTNTSLPVSTPGSLTPKAVSLVNHRPCSVRRHSHAEAAPRSCAWIHLLRWSAHALARARPGAASADEVCHLRFGPVGRRAFEAFAMVRGRCEEVLVVGRRKPSPLHGRAGA